jgi:hypothetical protein
MPYTVLTHTPLSYVADYVVYRYWPGFIGLRLVNILATLACAALIFNWVRARTKRLAAALFSASVFLLLPPVFQWSQTTRSPDAFCCLFALAALSVSDSQRRYRNLFIALFLTAAVLSKQTALFTLLPALLVIEWRKQRSLRSAMTWLLPSALALVLFLVGMQHATDGGFWTDAVNANICARSLHRFLFVTVRCLFFFWIFAACAWRFSRGTYTSAHVWGLFATAFGLLTCAKAGSDTMYFFDAGAAAAMLAGLGLDAASTKRAVIMVSSLMLCVFVPDAAIARTNAPIVADSYRRMVDDLRQYPTVLSDEASISIRTGRPWYWADPLVLNELGRQAKWDSSPIDRDIAAQRYSAIVVWNENVWSPVTWGLVRQNYALWRTYPAFKNHYSVYLPLNHAPKDEVGSAAGRGRRPH